MSEWRDDEIVTFQGRPYYWRLEGHEPVPATRNEMVRIFQASFEETRCVAKDPVGDAEVSTVFLVIDHAFSNGPPVLFETMIFGGDHDQNMWRYQTWDAAEAGHQAVVAALKDGTELPR